MATPKENKDLIKEFYKGINKKKAGYEYSPTGELLIKNKSGEVAKTVTLPTYRSPTETELVEQETKRFDAILAAEKVFEEARDASRRAELPSEIKHAMRAVELADQALQRVRYPLTQVSIYESIPIKSILFEMKKDEHKIKDVFAFVGRPFTLEEYYVRSTPLSPLPQDQTQPSLSPLVVPEVATGLPVLLVSLPAETNPAGFLSSWWPVYFTYKGTTYSNAYQGIMAELAKSFNNEALASTIRATPSPEMIELTLDMIPEATDTTRNDRLKTLVYDVNKELFKAHPELGEKLLQTGERPIGYVPPEDTTDTFLGIGLDIENPAAKDPTKWTGQNIYGKALEAIRAEIRTITLSEQPQQQQPVVIAPPKKVRLLRKKTVAEATGEAITTATGAVTNAISSVPAVATKAFTGISNAISSLAKVANVITPATAIANVAVATKAAPAITVANVANNVAAAALI